jgi:energy-converting hydrogenase A subunit M
MSSLRTSLESLAASFANDLVRAIQGSSLEELRSEVGGASRRGRPATSAPAKAVKRSKGGRLSRRSAADIAAALDGIVGLLKKHQAGLRAEQIRKALHMQAKEMPRVLSEGLSKKKLKKKGQKRATTYFAS